MAVVQYLEGATSLEVTLEPYYEESFLYIPAGTYPNVYRQGSLVYHLVWYNGAPSVPDSTPTYYVSAIEIPGLFSITASAGFPVWVEGEGYYHDGYERIDYQYKVAVSDVGGFFNDYRFGDEFHGNGGDNYIRTNMYFFHEQASGWGSGYPSLRVSGDERVFAYEGNDVVIIGYGEDIVDGGGGFDFYYAGEQRQHWQDPEGPVLETEGRIVNRVLPGLPGVQVNLSPREVSITEVVGAIGAPQWLELSERFEHIYYLDKLPPKSVVDSYQMVFQAPDTLISIEGARGSSRDDVIIAAGYSDESYEGFSAGGLAYGEAGNDVMIASLGTAFMSGGAGSDLMIGSEGEGEHEGDEGVDLLNGDGGDDYIFGLSGADVLWGGDGWDYLDGGGGFDWVGTHHEFNALVANLSDASIRLYDIPQFEELVEYLKENGPIDVPDEIAENMFIDSFGTFDWVLNFEGIAGGALGDIFVGGAAGGSQYGEGGDDILISTGGENHLLGEEGNDFVVGADMEDDVYGGKGDDVLMGAGGKDDIRGGEGDDDMFGGAGSDTFKISRAAGPGEGHGNNNVWGGASRTDVWLDGDRDVVEYDKPRSLFELRPNFDDEGLGLSILATYAPTGNVDTLRSIHDLRFVVGDEEEIFTIERLGEAGQVGYFLLALGHAFTRLREDFKLPDPPKDPSPWFKRFSAAVDVIEKFVEVGSEYLTTEGREQFYRRFSAVVVEEVFDFATAQARSAFEDAFLRHLPEDTQRELNESIDKYQGVIKEKVLSVADKIGQDYYRGTEVLGREIGEFLYDVWTEIEVEIGGSYIDLIDEDVSDPKQDVEDRFDVDKILFDEIDAPDPIMTPHPEGPALLRASLDKDDIFLFSVPSVVHGTLASLDGDTIHNFGEDDAIFVENIVLGDGNLTVEYGSAILKIDVDLDGAPDSIVTLSGDFRGREFELEKEAGGTFIRIQGGVANQNIVGTSGDDLIEGSDGVDLIYGLAGDDVLHGLSGRDSIYGGFGDDELHSGGGPDQLAGGQGNDRYFIDHKRDYVIEAAGAGEDYVYSSVGYKAHASEVEKIILTGNKNAWVVGNEVDNTIVGNRGANVLVGGGGADAISGMGGSDIFAFVRLPEADHPHQVTISDFTGFDFLAFDDQLFGIGSSGVDPRLADVTLLKSFLQDGLASYHRKSGEIEVPPKGADNSEAALSVRIGEGAEVSTDQIMLF